MAPRVLSCLSYPPDLCVCVCSWLNCFFFHSLAALMLLEIRMLTQSLIWLHRSQPSLRNDINTNVGYKLCSSLFTPPPLYICFSVRVDLNLNNQLSCLSFSEERVQSNEGNEAEEIAEAEWDERMQMRRCETVERWHVRAFGVWADVSRYCWGRAHCDIDQVLLMGPLRRATAQFTPELMVTSEIANFTTILKLYQIHAVSE